MNRKERRAALKQNSRSTARSPQPDQKAQIHRLCSEADQHYQQGQFAHARDICRNILARAPSDLAANNLMGLVSQALGRHRPAIAHFANAIAVEKDNALHHYNIAYSYQRVNLWDDAIAHFTQALALKMDGKRVEDFITRDPVIASCINRIAQQWPGRLSIEALFDTSGVATVADDALLRCALEKTELCGQEIENFLTSVRFALLQATTGAAPDFGGIEDKVLGFYAALAQQCFINEYVFAQSDDEARQADNLRSLLAERVAAADAIPSLLLIAVAAYFPLHLLPQAASLRHRDWPPVLNDLLRQQLFEPFVEEEIRSTIPSLTTIDDAASTKVKKQYEENPYPRWTLPPDISAVSDWRVRFPACVGGSAPASPLDVLVAGCGTGQNPIQAALKFPAARVLAVDLSLASLAYAARKTREAGIPNIEYAKADILKLGSISRTFDRIETVGVLHHLADPQAGWRVLLSLLRPGCIMDVGLYSETARRSIVAARQFIEERGYRATEDDIRRFRRELLLTRPNFANSLLHSPDFYSTSGCRDLLFHVMEHQFSIPQIAQFLSEHGLAFLGFRLAPDILDRYRSQFPDPNALTDLNCWHAFEEANPSTFASMYRFAVRKQRCE